LKTASKKTIIQNLQNVTSLRIIKKICSERGVMRWHHR